MRKASFLVLPVMIVFLAACNRPTELTMLGGAPGPKAWIDAPLDGSELSFDAYEVVFHVSDSSGMRAVQLVANEDVLYSSDNAGEQGIDTFRQLWNPPGPGEYELRARVQSSEGTWSPDAIARVVIRGEAEEPESLDETPETTLPTPTPTPTSTLTPTSTPEPPAAEEGEPSAVLMRNAHCRRGPSSEYSIMTSALEGWVVPLEGQPESRYSGWWYVLLPEFNVRCWIGGSSLDISGDTTGLPVILAPPLLPTETPPPTMPPIPTAPSNVRKTSITCGPLSLTIAWNDNSTNEAGFRVFRNNVLIATLSANTTTYTDNGIALGADYTYAVEAFNDQGTSARASQFIVGCPPLY